MAVLRCGATGRRVSLGARCLVGRGQLAQLEVVDPTISAEHASIYFDGSKWKLRDLASRNGTFVDDHRIAAQRSVVLEVGRQLRFGPNRSNTWTLECSAPPGPSALSATGERVVAEGDVLWLPSAEAPEACVRHDDETWLVETEAGFRFVADGDVLLVGGQRFTLELPPGKPDVALTVSGSTFDAQPGESWCLTFLVSQDEEHVSLTATLGSRTIDLGARAHNVPLLLLARRRQEETSRGIGTSEAGWVYSRDLFEMLRTDRETVNLLLWRATQCFKKAGVPGEHLIERRLDSGQVRIGIESIAIGLRPRNPR